MTSNNGQIAFTLKNTNYLWSIGTLSQTPKPKMSCDQITMPLHCWLTNGTTRTHFTPFYLFISALFLISVCLLDLIIRRLLQRTCFWRSGKCFSVNLLLTNPWALDNHDASVSVESLCVCAVLILETRVFTKLPALICMHFFEYFPLQHRESNEKSLLTSCSSGSGHCHNWQTKRAISH